MAAYRKLRLRNPPGQVQCLLAHNLDLPQLIDSQQSGNYYNFSNIRYGAPPVGNLRFSAPTAPTANRPVFNDGSKAVTCIQAVPAWTNYSVAWLTELTAAFNITAGYQPPNITVMPPQDPQESEDCLFLDIMVPKAIFNRASQPGGAPVYAVSKLSWSNFANEIGWYGFMEVATL